MFFGGAKKKQVEEIIPNCYYLPEFSMLDCNIYVLKEKSGDFCLIDVGNGKSWSAVVAGLENQGLDIQHLRKIVITHEHLDHILGLWAILETKFTSKPEIYVHPFTKEILLEGDEEKICPSSLGISSNHFGVQISPIDSISTLKDGDIFNFGDFSFQVLETPGHSIGSITLYDPNQKILFPGDVVFPQGSFGRYDFPGGNLTTLQKSIKKLAALDVNFLCSGHMPPVLLNASASIQLSYRNITSMRW